MNEQPKTESHGRPGEVTRREQVADFAARVLSYMPGHPGVDKIEHIEFGVNNQVTDEYRRRKTGELIRTKVRQHDGKASVRL